MRDSATGSHAAIPVRAAWRRPVPRALDRRAVVLRQILGITRWASPPPGVAWRRVALRLLLTCLALALWISGAP